MKKYALLSLLQNANRVIDECYAKDTTSAVAQFQKKHPVLGLDAHGYAKNMDISYCVAEYFSC
jgi:hypothetical protein